MTTLIFDDYSAFCSREDKSINGVSKQTAELHPDYISNNITNQGCWECLDCKNCTQCFGCMGCAECTKCTNCLRCINCDECEYCSDCIKCTGCKGFKNATELKNKWDLSMYAKDSMLYKDEIRDYWW